MEILVEEVWFIILNIYVHQYLHPKNEVIWCLSGDHYSSIFSYSWILVDVCVSSQWIAGLKQHNIQCYVCDCLVQEIDRMLFDLVRMLFDLVVVFQQLQSNRCYRFLFIVQFFDWIFTVQIFFFMVKISKFNLVDYLRYILFLYD